MWITIGSVLQCKVNSFNLVAVIATKILAHFAIAWSMFLIDLRKQLETLMAECGLPPVILKAGDAPHNPEVD